MRRKRRRHHCRRRRRSQSLLGWSYDVSLDTVVSKRLLGRDVWPGTWPCKPVAAPVVALLSPGVLPVRCKRHRRLVGTSSSWWGVWCGGTCNGSIV